MRRVLTDAEMQQLHAGHEWGPLAWTAVLAQVAAGTLHPDAADARFGETLLCCAAVPRCPASVMTRLLALGASPSKPRHDGIRPMTVLFRNESYTAMPGPDFVHKMKLLPPADLAEREEGCGGQTCLHLLAQMIARRGTGNEHAYLMHALLWVLDQPECHPEDAMRTMWGTLLTPKEICAHAMRVEAVNVIRDALEARKAWAVRWSPDRAAWIGAVACAGLRNHNPAHFPCDNS
jgi:hypothetical protein